MSHRYRLTPTPAQEAVMREHCAHARLVWNLCVEQQSWYRPGRGKMPTWVARCRQLTEARAEFEWLRDGSQEVQKNAIRDFDQAMQNFFAGTHRRPTWRKMHLNNGFCITGLRSGNVRRVSRHVGEVGVPKLGWVRFRWSRPTPSAKSYRVTLDRSGRWHVSFTADQPAFARTPTGTAVGIDRGVRTALVDSGGQHFRAPRMSDRTAERFLALSRKRARQQRDSFGRERTRVALARITATRADRRQDWAEKISTRMVREHDLIVLEKLNIGGMTRKPGPKPDPAKLDAFMPNRARAKAGLSSGILASCWGELASRIEHKAAASGVSVVQVNPRFTSQQCHVCGHTESGNRESQAVFRCVACGHEDHADRNAARNILARGLIAIGAEVPAHTPGHGVHRPHQSPASADAAGTVRGAA